MEKHSCGKSDHNPDPDSANVSFREVAARERKGKLTEPGTPDKSRGDLEYNGNSGAGTPIASHTSSPAHAVASAAYGPGGTMMTPEHCLAEVDERITFKPTENDEYGCRLHIQNIAQGTSIIFKIKTTSPDRYRVRPTIAVIECGGTAKVPITSQAGVSAAQIQRDRFQVQVCILPKDMLNDESCESVSSSTQSLHNSNFADLNTIFKKLINSSGAAIDTFKVAVCVEGRPGETGAVGPTVSMNEERMRKGLEDLEKKITESLWKKLEPKISNILMLLYIILAVLLCLTAVTIMKWLNCGNVDCGKACPDYMPKSACGSCSGGTSWV